MGTWGARKCAQVAENVANVLAIEAMVAAQGIDLREPHAPGLGVRAAHAAVREKVARLTEDRVLSGDVASARQLLDDGSLVAAVDRAVGALS